MGLGDIYIYDGQPMWSEREGYIIVEHRPPNWRPLGFPVQLGLISKINDNGTVEVQVYGEFQER